MPCMCGAADCPSCGPAQGYDVVRVWNQRLHRYVWRNPEPEDDEADDLEAEYGSDRDEDAESNKEY